MDEESFRILYERHARGLWAFLLRMTNHRALAEDPLQETSYRLLRAGSSHAGESHAKNALFRIAANLARDAHRRRRFRLPSLKPEADAASASDPGNGPCKARADVARALGGLKPRDRILLWLAYAEGPRTRRAPQRSECACQASNRCSRGPGPDWPRCCRRRRADRSHDHAELPF